MYVCSGDNWLLLQCSDIVTFVKSDLAEDTIKKS